MGKQSKDGLSEAERREVIAMAMEVVLAEVVARKLMPLVLVAGDGETCAILPCGPGAAPADVARILRDAADSLERHLREVEGS